MTEGGRGYVSKETVCQLFGLTGRRIEQLVADGVIERKQTKNGVRFETVSTIQRYIKYLSDKAYGRERSDREAELKEAKLRADVALKESQGELHRLRTEIAQGNYISVEEVKLDYSRFFVVFKKFALSIPGKMAGRLTGFLDPTEVRRIENELKGEIIKMLTDFVGRATTETEEVKRGDEMKPKKKGRPKKNAERKDTC